MTLRLHTPGGPVSHIKHHILALLTIVATLSGDIILYSADSMIERWRTHVHGAVGLYNSIRVEDLDGMNGPELYIAGSSGLWRFLLNPQQP